MASERKLPLTVPEGMIRRKRDWTALGQSMSYAGEDYGCELHIDKKDLQELQKLIDSKPIKALRWSASSQQYLPTIVKATVSEWMFLPQPALSKGGKLLFYSPTNSCPWDTEVYNRIADKWRP